MRKAQAKHIAKLFDMPHEGMSAAELKHMLISNLRHMTKQYHEHRLSGGRTTVKHILRGAGILDTVVAGAKYLGSLAKPLYDFFSNELVQKAGLKAYQLAANIWRKKNPGLPGRVSRQLYYGEIHPFHQNFTGPGTRLDLPEVRNFKPYDGVDACSKKHDLEYNRIQHLNVSPDEKARLVQKADDDAITCYDRHPNDEAYSLARAGIDFKRNAEKLYSIVKGKPSVFYGGRRKVRFAV